MGGNFITRHSRKWLRAGVSRPCGDEGGGEEGQGEWNRRVGTLCAPWQWAGCRGSICAGERTVSVLCLLAGYSDSGFAVVIGTAAIKVGSLPTMFGAGENREHDHPQNSAGEVRRQRTCRRCRRGCPAVTLAIPTRRNMRRIDVFREVSRSQEWLPYQGEIIKPATARAIVRLYDQSSSKVQRRITLLLNSGVGVADLLEAVRILNP